MKYIAGYVQLSPQMYKELCKDKCEDHASYVYALHGTRATCVCGQHDGLPPIAPLLLDEHPAE